MLKSDIDNIPAYKIRGLYNIINPFTLNKKTKAGILALSIPNI